VFRRNEIWRSRTDRRTGDTVGEELVKRNCALVTYVPTDVDIVDV
jgi:vancomycin resistance protein VanW